MKLRLLDLICCPYCQTSLTLVVWVEQAEIEDGLLSCARCERDYPVIGGIPRLLPDPYVRQVIDYHRDYFTRYEKEMIRYRQRAASTEPVDSQRRTLKSYSYQWRRFKEMLPHWEQVFTETIRPITPEFFRGKVGLDAGCGFGRSLYYSTKYGAEVIGIDLSEAVESARANTRSHPSAHVVQGDLHQLPVQTGSMDFIYSIGVLDHLPEPFGGFRALTRHLRPGAPIFIWVYSRGRGRQIAFFNMMRAISTRLPMRALDALSWLGAAIQTVCWITPYRVLSRWSPTRALAERIPFTHHARYPFRVLYTDWFDGLSVPLTFYYKAEEIAAWFQRAELERVETAPDWGWAGGGRALGYCPVRHRNEALIPS